MNKKLIAGLVIASMLQTQMPIVTLATDATDIEAQKKGGGIF